MIHLLWPSGVKYDKVLFFCFCRRTIYGEIRGFLDITLFPNIINLTYLAYGMHRISECLRNEYSAVDK